MDTNTLMALIEKKVPKDFTQIQALRAKFDKFDDRTRNELALEIKAQTANSNVKAMLETLVGGAILTALVYFGIEYDWFSRDFFDDFGVDFISREWKKTYDEPNFVLFFGTILSVIGALINFFNLPNDTRKENLKVIDELILRKTLDKN